IGAGNVVQSGTAEHKMVGSGGGGILHHATNALKLAAAAACIGLYPFLGYHGFAVGGIYHCVVRGGQAGEPAFKDGKGIAASGTARTVADGKQAVGGLQGRGASPGIKSKTAQNGLPGRGGEVAPPQSRTVNTLGYIAVAKSSGALARGTGTPAKGHRVIADIGVVPLCSGGIARPKGGFGLVKEHSVVVVGNAGIVIQLMAAHNKITVFKQCYGITAIGYARTVANGKQAVGGYPVCGVASGFRSTASNNGLVGRGGSITATKSGGIISRGGCISPKSGGLASRSNRSTTKSGGSISRSGIRNSKSGGIISRGNGFLTKSGGIIIRSFCFKSPSGGIISRSDGSFPKSSGKVSRSFRKVSSPSGGSSPRSGGSLPKSCGIVSRSISPAPSSGTVSQSVTTGPKSRGIVSRSGGVCTESGGIGAHIGIVPLGAIYKSCPKGAFGLVKKHPVVVIGAGNVVQSGAAKYKMVGGGGGGILHHAANALKLAGGSGTTRTNSRP